MDDKWVCLDCDFVGNEKEANEHANETGHDILRDSQDDFVWSEKWGD